MINQSLEISRQVKKIVQQILFFKLFFLQIHCQNFEKKCLVLDKQINSLIRAKCDNILVFLRAIPLICKINHKKLNHARMLGNFRREVLEIQTNCLLKFDILSHDPLWYAINSSRFVMLQCGSDDEFLHLEGSYYRLELFSIDFIIKQIISSKSCGNCKLEIILLAIKNPKLAEYFYEKIKNSFEAILVIYFDLNTKLTEESFLMDCLETYTMEIFCLEFLNKLLKEQYTVLDAILFASDNVFMEVESRMKINQSTLRSMIKEKIIKYKTNNLEFFKKPFVDVAPDIKLKTTEIKQKIAVTNVKKQNLHIVGRNFDTNFMMKRLFKKKAQITNLHGIRGIGKTVFIQYIAYNAFYRNYYEDGVYYFDLKKLINDKNSSRNLVDSFCEIFGKEFTKDFDSFFAQNSKMLLVFDHFQVLENKSLRYRLDIFLSMLKHRIDIIYVTRKRFEFKRFLGLENNVITCFYELKPFDRDETRYLILVHLWEHWKKINSKLFSTNNDSINTPNYSYALKLRLEIMEWPDSDLIPYKIAYHCKEALSISYPVEIIVSSPNLHLAHSKSIKTDESELIENQTLPKILFNRSYSTVTDNQITNIQFFCSQFIQNYHNSFRTFWKSNSNHINKRTSGTLNAQSVPLYNFFGPTGLSLFNEFEEVFFEFFVLMLHIIFVTTAEIT